jgi:lipopolysaccharide biosynthesis protein
VGEARPDSVRVGNFRGKLNEPPALQPPRTAPALPKARGIAFYLPQFHPIPENDEWWGPGFSEWTNTAKARPLFRNHHQPHVPADLGFYDLRLEASREAQAALAERYGLEAFCYWHYWFAGRRILERPYEELLASGRPDFSFCLGWANQTWTGIWHGADDRVLIEQTYPGADDDARHFEHVLPAFRDARYVRVDGKPLFYVFRPELLPDPAAFVDRWQTMAVQAGLEGLYLVAEVSDLLGNGPKYIEVLRDGFDAGVYVRLPAEAGRWSTLKMRAARKLLRWPERYRYTTQLPSPAQPLGSVSMHPCIYPNWDNTPRAGRRGLVITGASPDRFRLHARAAIQAVSDRPSEHRLVFIKSWNEWAEGNYLEPDLEFGHGFLDVLADELGVAREGS